MAVSRQKNTIEERITKAQDKVVAAKDNLNP